jgi:hypothetical protein
MLRDWTLILLLASCCQAADWEALAAAGFGEYHPVTYTAPAGTASAGIGARYVLNAAVSRWISQRFAAEAGWIFQDGDFEISSGGMKTAFDGHAHAVYVDLRGNLLKRPAKLQPFLEGGGGARFYSGIEEIHPRPLGQFGSFRDGTDARAMITAGGGLEWTLSPHWALRLDLRYVTTPFPTSIVVPAPGANLHGWLNDFVSTFGVTFK